MTFPAFKCVGCPHFRLRAHIENICNAELTGLLLNKKQKKIDRKKIIEENTATSPLIKDKFVMKTQKRSVVNGRICN